MRVLVQRVKDASVEVKGEIVGECKHGLLLFVGFTHDDDLDKLDWVVNKVSNLRVFEDSDGKMNLSLKDISGTILSISQFTLYGNVKKGFRPSFTESLEPNKALELFNEFNKRLNNFVHTETGLFGEEMKVDFINDGPVTLMIER